MGFLSGFFGIGGGTVIVPALVFLGFTQRTAAATSLLAILPAAVVGVIAYIQSSAVNYPAAGLLACGIIVGAQLGAKLLAVLPEAFLKKAFVVFLGCVGLVEFVMIPNRETEILLMPETCAILVLLGVATGVLSGILGLGGGVIVVPSLTFLLHASDLIARGTSLLMMIPGTVSGTLRNQKNHLTDFRAGGLIGACACVTSPLGKLTVEHVSPRMAAVLFGVYIILIMLRSLYVVIKQKGDAS